MTIRQALSEIHGLPYIGNKSGSFRTAKDFENKVTNILRNVGTVVERPNGANGFPSFSCNGINYQIKTSKGTKPMWNEVWVRPDSVLILNLSFGTVVAYGSLVTNEETEKYLIIAKKNAAKIMREDYPHNNKNFFVSGGRVQFGDNIDWKNSRGTFLHETIEILTKENE